MSVHRPSITGMYIGSASPSHGRQLKLCMGTTQWDDPRLSAVFPVFFVTRNLLRWGRLKMRDMNLRHQFARVEIAGHENAGPICRGGKCEKS